MTDLRVRAAGRALLTGLAIALAGCATAPPHRQGPMPDLVRGGDRDVAACARFWQSMEDVIDQAGVRDVQEWRVPGAPWLRSNRPLAGLLRMAGTDRVALVREMATLDRIARHAELANLPSSARERMALPHGVGDTVEAATGHCRALLSAAVDPETLSPPAIPDDYQSWKRALGAYALVRYPFSSGVRRHQAETARVFALPVEALPREGALRQFALDLDVRLEPDPESGLAAFDEATVHAVRAHAPVFEIDVVTDDDLPGFPVLEGPGRPAIDVERPTLFVRLSSQMFDGERRRQIVYSLWFPARPRAGPFDLLGGRLDGLLWRVTLDAEGRPLLYDSIHACGCYHQFFPTPAVRVRSAPDSITEWAFVPQWLAEPPSGTRLVLRVAARTHFLQRVTFDGAPAPTRPLALASDDVLRSLPLPGGERRSLFGPDGIVPGTQRGERWLFWPMGIRDPGAMRQWGRHATAFVGRRHFDDADLLDRHFERAR